MRRRRSLAAVVAALAVLMSACGVRVDSDLRNQAADAQLGVGGAGNGGVGGTNGSGTGGAGGNGSGTLGSGGTTGGTAGQAGTTGSGGGTNNGPGSVDNGGATDVGVTANSITVGNVADKTGPVPGLFATAPAGVDAYFRYINATEGGVYGRQLFVKEADSQTDCTANQNAHLDQLPKVFGWVGSFSLYDDCGTTVIKKNSTVPDVSYPLGAKTKNNTVNNIPPQAAPVGYQNGMFCHWAKQFPDAVKAVGSVYPNLEAAALSEHAFRTASESCGWKWIHYEDHPALQTRFDADIQTMKRKGVKLVFISAENAANAAEIKNEADDNDFHPIWIMPIAYAGDFIKRIGGGNASAGISRAEGIIGSNLYAMFFNEADAKNIPEVALFQKWMKQTHSGVALELYAMYGWAAAKLFVQILKAAGPKATRKSFMTAAKKVHSYNANGLLPQTDPASHKPSNCFVIWKIHNGVYSRQAPTPANKFFCSGTFVPYTGQHG
jgi:hypothetical protein